MKEKEYYKEQIIEMVQKISRCDILKYIYIIISDILKEEGNNA